MVSFVHNEIVFNALSVGDKIKFSEERLRYTVRAKGVRYAVCTKPFNPRHTTLYSVIDIHKQIRGTENLIFGMGAETDKQCSDMLERLEGGRTEVSHRRNIVLVIENDE